jgi:RNA-directed DNA polymerase
MDIAAVQKSLATKALYQPDHRFNDLYRYVRDVNWLESARNAILHNQGANTPGVDGVNGKELRRDQWCTLIRETVLALREDNYRPQPARRVYIPKATGKLRPLGIPTIQDRLVQEVIRMVLEPIYESHFLPCSYGFRPGRSTMTAIHKLQRFCNEQGKYFWIVEGDIKGCFDNIPHEQLIQVLRRVIKDERLLALVWAFLKAGYIEEGKLYTPQIGTPQGGIVSALLTNIYLHEIDKTWQQRYNSMSTRQRDNRRKAGQGNVQLVRYADDFLALTNGPKNQAIALKDEFGEILAVRGLTLSPEKTLITHINDGFDFLGFHIQRRTKRSEPERKVVYVTPTERNVQRYKEKIRSMLTGQNYDVVNKLRALGRVSEGWARYYQHVQSARIRQSLDHWTFKAVWNWLKQKHGGHLGDKALYDQYLTQRNKKGQLTLGYGNVFLARMGDIPHRKYYLPTGGIQNPYLTNELLDITISGDEPIREPTWNGQSAQNKYAIARQDLLMRVGPMCQLCHRHYEPDELDAHHKVAQSEGGKHGTGNLELRCRECHAQTASFGKQRQKM